MDTAEIMVMLFGSSGLIISLATLIKELIEKKIDSESNTEQEKMETLETLLQMGARTDLYQIYQFSRAKGFRSEEETDLFNEFYGVYKNKYNGNSYAEEIMKRFLALPQHEEDDE